MTRLGERFRTTDLERVRELTSIGAGHAATAFSQLLGRTFTMRVPTVRLLPTGRLDEPFLSAPDGNLMGIFFEVEGGLGGVLALLFAPQTGAELVQLLTGQPAKRAAAMADSALREVGNILASHVVSALSNTLGVAVLPSVPVLVHDDAASALSSLVALRDLHDPAVRIETEISDRSGGIRSVLVFVPDRVNSIAAHPAF